MSHRPRRPALLLASALVAGVVSGDVAPPPPPLVLGVTAAVLVFVAWALRRVGRRGATAALATAALLAGQTILDGAHDRARERIAGWLPARGHPRDLHVEARVVASAETGRHGERVLNLDAHRVGTARVHGPVRLRLYVRESPRAPTDRLDALSRGDRVRVWCRIRSPVSRGNPGEPDARRRLLAQGIDAVGVVKSARLVELLEPGPATPGRLLDLVKKAARRRLRRATGERAELLSAMLLGDRAAVAPDTFRVIRDAGLAHLMAISGLHVGVMLLALLGAIRRLPIPAAGTCLATMACLVGFAVLVGARSPVVRAAGCACLMLTGRAIHRDGDRTNTLGVVASALVMWRPWLVWDPGFQLTFAATAAIFLLSGRIASHLPLPRPLALSLGVTLAAYVGTMPFAALHFSRLTPVALISNLAAAPLCGTILICGFSAIVLDPIPLLGACAARAAVVAEGALLSLARCVERVPGGAFLVATPPAWLVVVHVLIVASFVRESSKAEGCPRSRSGRTARRIRVLLAWLVMARLHLGPFPTPPSGVEVFVLDVGQAQAVLARGELGGCILVDAAGTSGGRFDAGARVVAPLLVRLGCPKLEALVVTHDHDDHAGGALSLLQDVEVDELWITLDSYSRPLARLLREQARRRGAAVLGIAAGDRRTRAGFEVRVLHPPRSRPEGLDENNRSAVVRLARERASLLVVGDLEAPGERAVLSAKLPVRSEALVVGHHGARNASSLAFLEAVAPRDATISVGRSSRFGHPHPEALDRLRQVGARVHRTDRDGMIHLRSVARGWKVSTLRGCESAREGS